MLCPLVIIFRSIIAFKLVKNYTFEVFIHFDRTLLLYSGKIEAKRSFRLIKSSNFGRINLLQSYNPSKYHNNSSLSTLGALAATVLEKNLNKKKSNGSE